MKPFYYCCNSLQGAMALKRQRKASSCELEVLRLFLKRFAVIRLKCVLRCIKLKFSYIQVCLIKLSVLLFSLWWVMVADGVGECMYICHSGYASHIRGLPTWPWSDGFGDPSRLRWGHCDARGQTKNEVTISCSESLNRPPKDPLTRDYKAIIVISS